MKSRILIPLDGSKLAEAILPHAVVYANTRGAGITLLHVVSIPQPLILASWEALDANVARSMLEDAGNEEIKEYLEGIAASLCAQGMDTLCQILLNEAKPASAIDTYVKQHPEIELVAMSTHGRSGLGRLIFGSVAEEVVQGAIVPVLLARSASTAEARHDYLTGGYASIVVPLDGSEFAAQALQVAKKLAAPTRAILTLVSALTDLPTSPDLSSAHSPSSEELDSSVARASALQHQRRHLEAEGFNVRTKLEHGSPAEVVRRIAHEANADLIVMSTHGRAGLARLIPGSTAMRVVCHADCPVLLVHGKEQVTEREAEHARIALDLSAIG